MTYAHEPALNSPQMVGGKTVLRSWPSISEIRQNPHHDPKSGEFTSGPGGGAGGGASAATLEKELVAGQQVSVEPDGVDALMRELSDGPLTNLARLQVDGEDNKHLYRDHMREIPRSKMPQLPQTVDQLKPFGEKLSKMGVTAYVEQVDPRRLRMTQNQLSSDKVGTIYEHIQSGGWQPPSAVIIVSKEGAILDGHHRWAAAAAVAASGKAIKIPVLRVDLGIDRLLEVANEVSLPRKGLGQ